MDEAHTGRVDVLERSVGAARQNLLDMQAEAARGQPWLDYASKMGMGTTGVSESIVCHARHEHALDPVLSFLVPSLTHSLTHALARTTHAHTHAHNRTRTQSHTHNTRSLCVLPWVSGTAHDAP